MSSVWLFSASVSLDRAEFIKGRELFPPRQFTLVNRTVGVLCQALANPQFLLHKSGCVLVPYLTLLTNKPVKPPMKKRLRRLLNYKKSVRFRSKKIED